MATLEVRDLHVSVEESAGVHREILRGVNLTVREGQTHAIMGPNGSGKSTLAYAIAGHPKYLVTRGSVTLDGEDVLQELPMEFAVEAQKLVSISLEGSVG